MALGVNPSFRCATEVSLQPFFLLFVIHDSSSLKNSLGRKLYLGYPGGEMWLPAGPGLFLSDSISRCAPVLGLRLKAS